jgi:hypothetical protein
VVTVPAILPALGLCPLAPTCTRVQSRGKTLLQRVDLPSAPDLSN